MVLVKSGKRYSIIDLAESLKRGGDYRQAKYEQGLSGMELELLGSAHGRAGAALPTMALYRDLEIGVIDGGPGAGGDDRPAGG